MAQGRERIAAQPVLALAAGAVALATFLFVVRGAAPAEQLGGGYGRLVPAAAAVVAPLVAALAVVSPWEGLLAWLVVMPLLLIPRVQVTIGPLQVTLTTVLLAALVVGVGFERRRRAGAAALGSSRLTRGAWLVVAALSAISIASVVASTDVVGGLPIALHGVIEPAVLGAVVVTLRPDVRRLGWLGLAMGASVAIASVYSVLRISKVATSPAEVAAQRLQLAHFTYYNVGIYGDMLAMALPLLVVAFVARRRLGLPTWAVVLLLVGLGFSLIGLYATFSKSAWLGGAAAIALVAVLLSRTWPQRLGALVIGLVIAAFILPYPLYVMRALGLSTGSANPYVSVLTGFQGGRLSSWNPDSAEGEVSISERVLATKAALRMAVDHPLLGVGPGRFGAQYASPRYRTSAATRLLGSAHDFFPNVAAELGLPAALIALLVFIGASFAVARAFLKGGGLTRVVAVGLGAAILGFLIVGVTFGIDLYRPYRVMNADMLFAALLVAAAVSLLATISPGDLQPPAGEPVQASRPAPTIDSTVDSKS